ncbi:MAG TPA: filamentous hemagglutinin N-terminal domain-containing protein [Candidatus Sulfotelmatobacter sp.]|nr:filamentous hemagglutinin N-terminal domain-containing protein [Candidatus Sulfotelmatobacter sp.]
MNTDSYCHWRRALVWPALLVLLACRFEARANPTGGTVTQGQATITGQGTPTVNVNQTSGSAWINWNTFNVGQNETVNFNQPSATSITWNQINQGNPSQILGDINANGYVVLENANGFVVGGSAVMNVHGLVMTTASTPAINLSTGGPWCFNAPPPTAKIENFGQINITGGGTAYLIAADIVNGGTITAPNGHIGLYDGETVLVSTAPNGEGLSAEVTLPQGSVDNEGKLTADGGSVVAQAQFVNQNGIIQANTAENVNGTIELLGSSSVTLGANSAISAQGDAQGVSSGGSVSIQAGNTFSDQAGSTINVAGGAQGGNGGNVDICAPQMATINSLINGQALAGFAGGTLTIDPADIWLDSANNAPSGYTYINVNNYNGLSQINIQADDDIVLNTIWQLTLPAALSLSAGNDITLNSGSGIYAATGGSSSLSLQAGNEIALGSGSEIEANGGSITLKAPTVDQAGTLQANSVGSVNGVIEIDASLDLSLEGTSQILATGDPNDNTSASPGGFVVLNAGNTYSDNSGSTISVSGNSAGGQGGIVEIFDPGSIPIQSTVSGAFAYVVNPDDLYISANPTTPSTEPAGGSYPNAYANFNVNDLAAYSQIDLLAPDDIELSAVLTLPGLSAPGALSLTAGNNITLDSDSGINAGQDWTLNLTAGAAYSGTTPPASSSDGIYLDATGIGQSYILAQNGNINLWAANEVQVGWVNYANSGVAYTTPGEVNPGAGSISTANGGNINVTTVYGDVNTGSDPNGFSYSATGYSVPDTTATLLGGISTAAGGNVNIAAGGNVISYMPTGQGDAGSGAFGSQAGNVTITAGGSVYGHYVVANGAGTITAGQNIGSGTENVALSLVDGGWSLNAPNGSIYLQEVRNPNGVFNDSAPHGRSGDPAQYLFNYSPDAYVDLTADAVYLTDLNVPRPFGDVPVLYPPILDILAGSGGVTLEGNVALFPSPDQNLDITIDDGGNLATTGGLATPYYLLMSDSAYTAWTTGAFLDTDHGALADEPNDSTPVSIDVSGNMEDLNLIVDKVADITVGGDMINSGFSGQNLQASDITSINVAGVIYSTSPYSFVSLTGSIPDIPAGDLPPGVADSWNTIFTLAVKASALASYQLPTGTPISQWLTTILENPEISLFQVQNNNGVLTPVNAPSFVYNAATGQLGLIGQLPSQVLAQLAQQPITILHLVNGQPVIDENPNDDSPGRTYGQFETDTISWVSPSAITQLASEASLSDAPSLSTVPLGYRIGGPGQFDITADAISLGASDGILSCGIYDPIGGFNRYGNLASITPVGATINVLVTGSEQLTDPLLPAGPENPYIPSLDMLTSTIASLDGGSINVLNTGGAMDLGSSELINSTGADTGNHLAFGIYTTGGGDVNVTSLGDVDIDGSRIATYDGGDVFVESETGDVNIGSGGSDLNVIDLVDNDLPSYDDYAYQEDEFGSGIQAKTPVPPLPGEAYPANAATVPGNITVETPQGSIEGSTAGIIQEALNGQIVTTPTVTLDAGTFASGTPGQPDYIAPYVGNIDLAVAGVIGINISLSANGNITGEIVSSQNSTVNAALSFSGEILAGEGVNITAGGSVAGTIVGISRVNVVGTVSATLLGQNVSANGGPSQSTLGSSATATASTQSATQQASSQAQQTVVADQAPQENNDKKDTKIRKVGRVTVLLSAAVAK